MVDVDGVGFGNGVMRHGAFKKEQRKIGYWEWLTRYFTLANFPVAERLLSLKSVLFSFDVLT